MKITRFFSDTLNAELKNALWSWGASDSTRKRVFLRVWKHDIETLEDGQRVVVGWDKPRLESQRAYGFAERQAHLALMQNGALGFGIICTAADPRTQKPRKILAFDQTTLLRLGALTHENGRTYAWIDGRVSVAEIIRQSTVESTLTEDLASIERRIIDSTTKQALINARIGQGRFRTEVLQLWGNCCSVKRSVTLDVIRASHIKPWRESTDEERLDPRNGLPLVASFDALFDAGLISFESSGKLIMSSILSKSEQQILGIGADSLIKRPAAKTADYLMYHRDHVFRE